jgi:hypothetical protein
MYDVASSGNVSLKARLAYRRVGGEGGLPSRAVVPRELVARASGEIAPP